MASLETGVRVAEALDVTREGLASLDTRQWESPSLCSDWDSQTVLAHVLWRLDTSFPGIARDILTEARRSRSLRPDRCMSRIAIRRFEADGVGRILDQLSALSADCRSGARTMTSAALVEAVVHGYDAAQPRGIHLRFDAETTSAVAHASSRLAPRRIRGVLRSRRLVAVDDGWTIGSGSGQIRGTAESIILYLNGRRSLIAPDELPQAHTGPVSPHPGIA